MRRSHTRVHDGWGSRSFPFHQKLESIGDSPYDSFSFVQLQETRCTKKAFFHENTYEQTFFSAMLALRKALKGKK